ncbi:hypothetical protein ACTQZS_07985 [Bilifractor sp. LCP19S3_H10]|uniref:hypothetical protein n=1 Tax=Bilifractor sp. LCP19S3_H10 TaxID=3438736 RepID=UPI003F8F2703
MKEKSKNHIYHLTFIGFDSWDRPVYEDQNMKLWKDVDPMSDRNPKLCSALNNNIDGEPDIEMRDGDVRFYPERVTWDWTRKNNISDLFEKVDQIDLRSIPGKVLLGYHRLYFRAKHWNSTFISNDECKFPLDEEEYTDVMELKRAICIFWPRGVNWKMEEDMRSFRSEDKKRFILRVKDNPDIYLLFDLRFGNADYPIRIYVYRNINSDEPEKDEHYTSSTARDYGPGNPWDAPGMSIKDFI